MNSRLRFRQCGFTLIELMVGLTISLVIVLAMLALFKTTAFASATAGRDASTDRQRLSGLYAAQKLLVGAGYGIDVPAVGTDLIVLAGATLDTDKKLTGTPAPLGSANINAVIWGAKLNLTNYRCQGLYAPANGGLVRLAETDCVNAAAFSSITWSPTPLIDDSRADHKVQIVAANATVGCQSFGITGSGKVAITLDTANSIEGTNKSVATTACLLNFTS
jgi:prepilin-type N-terminal cleavage/methylation domain-containing protein